MSGLRANVNKTQFMPTANSTTKGAAWKSVKNYRYLGIVFNNHGNIEWDKITQDFIKRCKTVKAGYMNNTLMHKVKCINAYCISMLSYHLRIAQPPKDITPVPVLETT